MISLREPLQAHLTDPVWQSSNLHHLALAYWATGQARRAISLWEENLTIDRAEKNRRGEGVDLGNLGNAYLNLGQVERAIDYYQQALAISREVGDRAGEGVRLGNLGGAYRDLGQVERAIDYHQQALAISREVGDRAGEGVALGSLGNAYLNLGQVERAIDYYQQALAIDREVGNRIGEAVRLGNLGTAYRNSGQLKIAIERYQQALTIDREVGDPTVECYDLSDLAYARLLSPGVAHSPQLKEISQSLGAALKLAQQVKDPRLIVRCHARLGLVHLAAGQSATAGEQWAQGLTVSAPLLSGQIHFEIRYNHALMRLGQAVLQPSSGSDPLPAYEQALSHMAAPGVVQLALTQVELLRAFLSAATALTPAATALLDQVADRLQQAITR